MEAILQKYAFPFVLSYYIKLIIGLVIMTGRQFVPAPAPITQCGMALLGIFLGLIFMYAALDILWPNFVAILILSLYMKQIYPSSAADVGIVDVGQRVFGGEIPCMLIGIFLVSYALEEAGVIYRLAVWFITRRFAKKGVWSFTFMIFLATFCIGLFFDVTPLTVIMLTIAHTAFEIMGFRKGDAWPKTVVCGITWIACISYACSPVGHNVPVLFTSLLYSVTGYRVTMLSYLAVAVISIAAIITTNILNNVAVGMVFITVAGAILAAVDVLSEKDCFLLYSSHFYGNMQIERQKEVMEMAENNTPAEEKPFIKREIQNSVFCDLFSDSENQLKLYNFLHPEDTSVALDDFKTETIQNIMTNQMYNDLGFSVRDRLLILTEAQSTWSVNIIVRIVMYYGETLNNYIADTKQRKYGSAKLSIPKPEFYVVYTGTDKKNVNEAYNLADEFFDGDDAFINVKVKVLRADTSRHDIVTQYIMFTRILAEQEKLYGRTQKAITETIRICKDRDVLREYLEKKEQEVITIMRSLFSQEDAMREYGDERAAEGRAEGRVEGRAEGRAKGRAEGRAEGRVEGRAEGEICGAVNLAKDMNMTDKQIEDYLMRKFNLSRDEAKKYLVPAYV